MNEFSGIIKSTGVALEKEAYKQFGSAVENQVKGALGKIFGSNKGATLEDPEGTVNAATAARQAQIGVWDPTKYAAATTSAEGGYQPKTKFLFKIGFKIHPQIISAVSQLDPSFDKLAQQLTFVIKQIDLPSVQFEYQEVNMYNFRTKVLKSINYKDIDLTFYDDSSNNALDFYNTYLKILKPITRSVPSVGLKLDDFAMVYAKDYNAVDTSYRGVPFAAGSMMPNDIISQIVIEQFYIKGELDSATLLSAVKMNTFTFTNPRIITLDLSELDYEDGNTPNSISLTFNFDAINMQTSGDAMSLTTPVLNGKDILRGSQELPANIVRKNGPQAGKARNPFIDIIARQGQRAIQTGVSSVLNKKLGNIAGGALGGAIGAISGALGAAAGNTLASVASGIAQNIAIPTPSFIRKDSNTSSQDVTNLSSSQGSGGP